MRKTFFEHYRPTKGKFDALWADCVFCFDTNVLLDIYRYTPDTRDRLFTIFSEFQDRIWIPFQVGKEFHEQRFLVIRAQEIPYDQIFSEVSNAVKKVKTQISELPSLDRRKPHPFINVHEIFGVLDNAVEQVESILKKTKEFHPRLLDEDPLLVRLSELFDGKVGTPYDQNELDEKFKKIQLRYKHEIPPGYKDLGTKEPPVQGGADARAYGDAIAWFQILDFATQQKRSVIFVTGDTKEDWWLKIHGKTLGPRPELIKEMKDEAGVNYYQYRTETFLKRAGRFLNLEPDPQAVDEIRDLRLQDEESAAVQALRMAEEISKLARYQLEIEEQVSGSEKRLETIESLLGSPDLYITPDQAAQIGQAVKAIAMKLSKASGRNEYGSVYGELYRKYQLTSYKQMTAVKFGEAMSWLLQWLESLGNDDPLLPMPVPS